jgi:WD40 repeat protein
MKDYSSQIAIYLKNNFNHKRTPQPTLNSPQQRITRSLSTSISRSGGHTFSSVVENENSNHGCNSNNDNGNILSAYFRCYVEDYMILPHDELLLLCIPDEVKTFERYESDAKTKFGSKVYRLYYSKIISAPHYHLCRNGMKYIDLNHAFNDGKYGSYVSLIQPRLIHCSASNNLINNGNDSCILLTWKEVLHGRMTGIQVWRKRENGYRDVYTSLSLDPSSKSFLVGTELSQRYSIDISSFTPELRGTCHYAEIFDLKFPTQCSELFVTASVQDIRVWNARQRQELLRIKVPNMSCYAIDITNSGSNIVSAWSDGKIRSFLPESGKVRFVIPDAHPDSVTALTTCNDDDLRSDWRLVSGGNDGGIRVWLITKSHQRMLHSMKEHRGTINSVVCNKDGSQIISASADGSFIVWDLGKGIRIHALFDQTVFKDVLFHPDESQYLTCQTNCKISYWDAYDGSAIRVIDGGDTDMTCLDIKPDGNIFVSGSADKSVRVWNYDDGITIGIGQRHSGKVSRVAISPDQQNLVSVGSEGGIFIWDISDMRQ